MKISKIILKGVNNFEDFTYSFQDSWTKAIPDTLLLIGPNGCGKTTILRAISNLWHLLGCFWEKQPQIDGQNSIFFNCQLAAVEIKDFLSEIPEPIWIYEGDKNHVAQFLEEYENDHKIGGTQEKKDDIYHAPIKYMPPGSSCGDAPNLPQQWVEKLRERYIQNRLGGSFDLPNLVFLESEVRTLHSIKEEYSVIPEQEVFNWLTRYNTTNRREGSIQNYLFTLKVINPEKYDRIISAINSFLTDKHISGFDQTTADLMITTKSGKNHPVHLLSSGEKQILLSLAFITRKLRPGGIILIDEPDLHLHVSLSNGFVSHLKRIAAEQKGQLIMASHSPKLWELFTQVERVELGSFAEVQ